MVVKVNSANQREGRIEGVELAVLGPLRLLIP